MTTAIMNESTTCAACNGRGVKVYGYVNFKEYPCSPCKGTGKVTAERLKRIAGAKQARVTRAVNLETGIASFKAEHAAEYSWLNANCERNTFASSLMTAVHTYGRLSEKQLAAVTKCVATAEVRKAEFAAKALAEAPNLGAGAVALIESFRKAQFLGSKRPKIRIQGITFSLAPDSGKNAGQVYVKATGGVYLGKINDGGAFFSSRDCTAEQKVQIQAASADPLAAAIDYGRKTGECACCGKALTDDKSVELGIGPICLKKYFGVAP